MRQTPARLSYVNKASAVKKESVYATHASVVRVVTLGSVLKEDALPTPVEGFNAQRPLSVSTASAESHLPVSWTLTVLEPLSAREESVFLLDVL